MTSDCKKPSAGFWITVTLVAVLVGYPLSFGPACWLAYYDCIGIETLQSMHGPILWIYWHDHSFVSELIYWYSAIGTRGRLYVPFGGATLVL
jgi:hypothetical protein